MREKFERMEKERERAKCAFAWLPLLEMPQELSASDPEIPASASLRVQLRTVRAYLAKVTPV